MGCGTKTAPPWRKLVVKGDGGQCPPHIFLRDARHKRHQMAQSTGYSGTAAAASGDKVRNINNFVGNVPEIFFLYRHNLAPKGPDLV